MKPARYVIRKLERNDDDSEFADRMNQAIAMMSNQRYLYRILIVLGVFNLLIWLSVLLFSSDVRDALVTVNDLNSNITLVVIGFIFGLGMFFTYALFRLKFPDIEDAEMNLGPMDSFNYQTHSNRRWWVWLFSVTGGIVNLLLLTVVDISLSSGR